nr:hypothetical protein [uncultured Chryseobacterium sp.]
MLSEIKLKALKEISGGFSRDEALWASGFLAGLAEKSSSSLSFSSGIDTENSSPGKITLAYGTETGNSKKLAVELAGIIKKKGVKVNWQTFPSINRKTSSKKIFSLSLSVPREKEILRFLQRNFTTLFMKMN